ncbi:MAG: hypothetical protein NC926_10420 [Candidatus Omnitrophica bacterium]|nr:hypothetical protein [Candidatus Omnitrophota bacterium]
MKDVLNYSKNFKPQFWDYFRFQLYFSTTPEGKRLGKVDIPFVRGFLILIVEFLIWKFTGYFEV